MHNAPRRVRRIPCDDGFTLIRRLDHDIARIAAACAVAQRVGLAARDSDHRTVEPPDVWPDRDAIGKPDDTTDTGADGRTDTAANGVADTPASTEADTSADTPTDRHPVTAEPPHHPRLAVGGRGGAHV